MVKKTCQCRVHGSSGLAVNWLSSNSALYQYIFFTFGTQQRYQHVLGCCFFIDVCKHVYKHQFSIITGPWPRNCQAKKKIWLATLNYKDNNNTTTPPSQSTESTTINSQQNGIDMTLPFFHDMLSDVPISSADEVGSLGNWSKWAVEGLQQKNKGSWGSNVGRGNRYTHFITAFTPKR
jgi:hypothetical protein